MAFLYRTVVWLGILLILPILASVLGEAPLGGSWTFLKRAFLLSAWVGLFLPFAAFAGGLAADLRRGAFQHWLPAIGVCLLTFLLLGFFSPLLQYEVESRMGLDLATQFPTGPRTISGLKLWRTRVVLDPPSEYSLSAGQPLRTPPNWITYLIHSQLALSLFALFSVLSGTLSSFLTTGLSPPGRQNVRWAIGLLSGAIFFAAEAFGGDWVRADPSHSGILGAWGPILIPIVELVGLRLLLAKNGTRSTVSRAFSSDG